jgi:hypothetical protein
VSDKNALLHDLRRIKFLWLSGFHILHPRVMRSALECNFLSELLYPVPRVSLGNGGIRHDVFLSLALLFKSEWSAVSDKPKAIAAVIIFSRFEGEMR